MLDEGLITQDQFQRTRAKLLGLPADIAQQEALPSNNNNNNNNGHGNGEQQRKVGASGGVAQADTEHVLFPTHTGVAFSPLKHPLQGGSLLVSSCPNKVSFCLSFFPRVFIGCRWNAVQ